MSLEDEFEAVCLEAIDACGKLSPPYHPTAWQIMIKNHGAVEAARRLVVSGDIQSGFERLVRAGRPDLTIGGRSPTRTGGRCSVLSIETPRSGG